MRTDSPTPPSPRASRAALILATALAVAHFCWLVGHLAPATMSPDANGYVVQARLLATEATTALRPESPAQFVGMHWLETDDGVFRSRYPAGLPVLLAGAWTLGGLEAALLVTPLLASLTILLVFSLGQSLVGDGRALVAAAIMAVAPVANEHALAADAHTSATFFLLAGVVSGLRFAQTGVRSTGFLAGLLIGVVPTLRYPEALPALILLAWLAWRVRPVRRLWPAVLGAALPVAALLVGNTAAYGAPGRTGYALAHEQAAFAWRFFTSQAIPELHLLGGSGLWLFLGLGLAGLAAMVADRRQRALGILFTGLTVPLGLAYMAYYFGTPGENQRFLIPTYPYLILAGVWMLTQLPGSTDLAALGAVATLQLAVGGATSALLLEQARISLHGAAEIRYLAEERVPQGSVLLADRQLAESLDALGRWRLVDEDLILGRPPEADTPAPSGGVGAPRSGSPSRAWSRRYADVQPAARRARAWADLETWSGGAPVYWLAPCGPAVEEALPPGARMANLADLCSPAMMGVGSEIQAPRMGIRPGVLPGPARGSGGQGGATGLPDMRRLVRIFLAPNSR